jgi:hypothetical protein
MAPRFATLAAVLLAVTWEVACGGGSAPSGPTVAPTPASAPPTVAAELQPVIEALFLGSGPLVPRNRATGCFRNGYWHVFPPGTVVLRVSTTVPASARQALEASASQLGPVTRGALQVAVETTDDPLPMPGPGEVTVTAHPDPVSQGCPLAIGCTFPIFGGVGLLQGARAVLPPGQTTSAFVHDAIGHGVLGLCHLDGSLAGGPALSLMSAGPGVFSDQIAPLLSERDLRAIHAVYVAGLERGGPRASFADLGLVAR